MDLQDFNAHRKRVSTERGEIAYVEIGEGPVALVGQGRIEVELRRIHIGILQQPEPQLLCLGRVVLRYWKAPVEADAPGNPADRLCGGDVFSRGDPGGQFPGPAQAG